MKTKLQDNGFAAPLCWYKQQHEQHTPDDEKGTYWHHLEITSKLTRLAPSYRIRAHRPRESAHWETRIVWRSAFRLHLHGRACQDDDCTAVQGPENRRLRDRPLDHARCAG